MIITRKGDRIQIEFAAKDLGVEELDSADNIERDFKDYIASQIRQEKGPFACQYCKHRESGAFGHCVFTGCDGIAEWEYGEPEEAEG